MARVETNDTTELGAGSAVASRPDRPPRSYEELLDRGLVAETPGFVREREDARHRECLAQFRSYYAVWKHAIRKGRDLDAYLIVAREVHLMFLSWDDVDRYFTDTAEYREMEEWLAVLKGRPEE